MSAICVHLSVRLYRFQTFNKCVIPDTNTLQQIYMARHNFHSNKVIDVNDLHMRCNLFRIIKRLRQILSLSLFLYIMADNVDLFMEKYHQVISQRETIPQTTQMPNITFCSMIPTGSLNL